MTFNWFKIFNLVDFNTTGLVSRTYTLYLEGVGQKDILVTKGNLVSIVYGGVMLSIGMNGENPFVFEGLAIYLSDDNDVYLGFEIEA